jgi:hypothetical protein
MSRRIALRRTISRGATCLLIATLAACGVDSTGPTAPLDRQSGEHAVAVMGERSLVIGWDDAMMVAIRAGKPAPTVVARALAVLHTAMYDAWAAYDANAVGTQYGASLRRPPAERTEANKRAAVSFAAYRALVDLFPSFAGTFAARMVLLGYDPADASRDLNTPAGIGNVAADAVLTARHRDGSNQLGDLHPGAYTDYTGYVPVNTATTVHDPLRWQPLTVSGAVQTFATPHWNRVTPFALRDASEFRPNKVKYQESPQAMRKAIDQVLEYSRDLDDRTKAIAQYWADGPGSELPPGHWCLFAAWVSERDQNTLDQDVKLFFAVANAVLDAGIAAWDAKRYFDSARPVTAIHYYMSGKLVRAWAGPFQGTREIRGEEWQPYQPTSVVTPPFSEFVSGHSTFSTAAAEVLRRFTGSDAFGASVEIPAGSSRIEPGIVPARNVTLSWRTFTEAADEAGMSRRYGGIHFAEGDLEGRRMGRKIGALVWAKAERLFEGKQ